MSRYENLLSPIKVGTHTYKNRVIAAPIYCGPFINLPGLDYVMKNAMVLRAKGGQAQVTIGETAVDFKGASREPFPPINYEDFNDPSMEKFKKLVDDIKGNGAKAMIELSHCGESVEKIPGVEFGIGPMGYTRDDGMVIYAMDKAKMDEVTQNFITSAKWMKEAGFDGVMIHTGHGWLLHQFLSSRTNKRTDEFGGSLENRAKFPLSLLKSVRDAMGEDFIIEIRVSGDEAMEGGMGIDETVEFCKMAQDIVDLIHVSVGVYRNPILSGEFSSLFHEHALNAEMSKAVKDAVDVPVAVVGGINSADLAEKLIKDGKCDIVALARQLTADPNFVNKAQEGRGEDITECIRCYKCFPGPLEGVSLEEIPYIFGCTVNPEEFFYDFDLVNSKPEASRSVLVVGGGIAGLEAAIYAHDRGHKVKIIEKSEKLGGLLFFTDTDYYKGDLKEFKDLLIRRVKERNIEIEFNKEFTIEDAKNVKQDAVILAIGSSPIKPGIKGIENAKKALDVYYEGVDSIGEKVVMIGGGLVGCEVGLHLSRNNKDVTIIEMCDKVAPDSYPMHRLALVNEMDTYLKYDTNTKCMEIMPDGVIALDAQGNEKEYKADTVIYALGMTAHRDETIKLHEAIKDKQVFEIGDCVCASKVFEACRQAYVAALSIK